MKAFARNAVKHAVVVPNWLVVVVSLGFRNVERARWHFARNAVISSNVKVVAWNLVRITTD